jgi:hypothetical protein
VLQSVDCLNDRSAIDSALDQLRRAIVSFQHGRLSAGQVCWQVARAYEVTEPAVRRHPKILGDAA